MRPDGRMPALVFQPRRDVSITGEGAVVTIRGVKRPASQPGWGPVKLMEFVRKVSPCMDFLFLVSM